jgi:hypothetical protein
MIEDDSFDFRGGNSMARDVDDIICSTLDPIKSVFVTTCQVAGELGYMVRNVIMRAGVDKPT